MVVVVGRCNTSLAVVVTGNEYAHSCAVRRVSHAKACTKSTPQERNACPKHSIPEHHVPSRSDLLLLLLPLLLGADGSVLPDGLAIGLVAAMTIGLAIGSAVRLVIGFFLSSGNLVIFLVAGLMIFLIAGIDEGRAACLVGLNTRLASAQ